MPTDDRNWDVPPKPPAAGYDVGYGKPPKATRFQPGTSGNPRGRPRGSRNRSPSAATMERMQAIVLQEAYGQSTVRDGDRPVECRCSRPRCGAWRSMPPRGSRAPWRCWSAWSTGSRASAAESAGKRSGRPSNTRSR